MCGGGGYSTKERDGRFVSVCVRKTVLSLRSIVLSTVYCVLSTVYCVLCIKYCIVYCVLCIGEVVSPFTVLCVN